MVRQKGSADWILLAGASFCALILLYALWNHEAYFHGPSRIAAYYLLPLLGIVVLLLATKLDPARKANFALLVGTGFVCVYLLELLLAAYPTVSGFVTRESADGFDRRTKLEVVRDLREAGVDAHLLVQPTVVVHEYNASGRHPIEVDGRPVLPLGAIANTTTVGCNETGRYLVYESDERGFHNPRGLWSQAPFRIVVLGDSFALGYCVASGQNAVAVLRRRHPSILNLGMGGGLSWGSRRFESSARSCDRRRCSGSTMRATT